MKRDKFLDEAKKCVCHDRNNQYGEPEDSFKMIAEYWNLYLGFESGITSEDVAIMMALLKIARVQSGQPKDDNYIDCIGYMACAGEIKMKNNIENGGEVK